ncbi:MAG: pur operon repressor [Bacillota bacterium]
MGKLRRSERLAAMVKTLVDQPAGLFSLTQFAEMFEAAKSTISEDLGIVKDSFERFGLGRVETFAGAAGGVKYLPELPMTAAREFVVQLCEQLKAPDRILPGGFLYMTDVIFSPAVAARIGEILATRFRSLEPGYVLTVETKGIPMAMMTARFLGLPLVALRRGARVTEGTAVSINYLSGSDHSIQSMSLAKRALPRGARVIFIDDFMRAGGTARGTYDLMAEFEAEVVGVGVFMATTEPRKKLIDEYTALTVIDHVDEAGRKVGVRPAAWLGQD